MLLQQQLISVQEQIYSLQQHQAQLLSQLMALCMEPEEQDPRMKQPISSLLISNLIQVKLRRHGVLTVGDVCSLGVGRLRMLPKVGEQSVAELLRALEREGIQVTEGGKPRQLLPLEAPAHDLTSAA